MYYFFFFFKQKTAYEIGLGIPTRRSSDLLRLSPLRRGLAIDSTVDIFTFYVPHRHVYGEQWIKFMKDGVNATPLPTVNTTGYIDHAAFLGTINPDTNKSGMVNRSEERFSRERSEIGRAVQQECR